MSRFAGLEAFVAVADVGSFRGGAARLGLSPAAVSKAVARLEGRLGVRLFDRTSRTVSLTAEGSTYLRRCREALDALDVGLAEMGAVHEAVAGTLSVTAPYVLGGPMMAHLPRLVGPHPDLQLDLRWSDHYARLLAEDIDVAVRVGTLTDSDLIARRLGAPLWATVAAPHYLARRPPIRAVADLERDHVRVGYRTTRGTNVDWSFADRRGGPGSPLRVPPTHTFDQGELLVRAAVHGVGVVQVFGFLVAERVAAGELVEVLPERAAMGPQVHVLCRPHQAKTPRIRAFFDWATGLRLR